MICAAGDRASRSIASRSRPIRLANHLSAGLHYGAGFSAGSDAGLAGLAGLGTQTNRSDMELPNFEQLMSSSGDDDEGLGDVGAFIHDMLDGLADVEVENELDAGLALGEAAGELLSVMRDRQSEPDGDAGDIYDAAVSIAATACKLARLVRSK